MIVLRLALDTTLPTARARAGRLHDRHLGGELTAVAQEAERDGASDLCVRQHTHEVLGGLLGLSGAERHAVETDDDVVLPHAGSVGI